MGVAILEGDRTCPRAPRVKCYYPHSPWWLDSLFSPRYLDTIGIGASLFIHISQLSYTMTTNSISSRLAKAKHFFWKSFSSNRKLELINFNAGAMSHHRLFLRLSLQGSGQSWLIFKIISNFFTTISARTSFSFCRSYCDWLDLRHGWC